MGSFPQTNNDPSLSSRFLGNCPPTPPLCQCVFFFFGDSKADVLRRKLSKLYDRAKQSRQGSALVNVFINVLFERGRLFKS